MSATHQVLVGYDGEVIREPATGGMWLVRQGRYFVSSGYACQRMRDDNQPGVLVYVERPKELFEIETKQRSTSAPRSEGK